jgi:hypothetical protein
VGVVLVGALALTTSACSSGGVTSHSYSSAEATVRAYYADLAAHDWNDAAALLQPSQRKTVFDYPDSPAVNLVSLSNVRTDAHYFPDAFSGIYANEAHGYGDIWQVFVTYKAAFRQVVTAHSGNQAAFAYVGRKGRGPWTILSIGSGP